MMKIWVVGESSPDPETWSRWSEFSIVVAATKEEAKALADAHQTDAVTEIPMDRPLRLCSMPEPAWGRDV